MEEQFRKRIKELEYQLYWKDRNAQRLLDAMLYANTHNSDLECDCHLCVMAGFWDGDYSPHAPKKDCVFRPWLNSHMSECGLTKSVPDTGSKPSKTLQHCSNEQGKVFDIDCHLVTPDGYFCIITPGKLLWNAELGSEELKKYDRFFKVLNPNA